MQRRHLIICVVLIAVVLASGWAAVVVLRKQQLTAAVVAGVPPIPDLSRWPAEFPVKIRDATEAALNGDDQVGSLAQLVTLYHANGFSAEAEQGLAALSELEPTNGLWPYRIADLHMRRSDFEGAEENLRITTNLSPEYLPAWLRLAGLLAQRNELEEARDCYTRAAEAAPGDVNAEFAIILFEAQKGLRGDPRKRLMALVEANHGIRQLHELLAELHKVVGDNAGAAQERLRAENSTRDLVEDDAWLDELAPMCFDPNRLNLLATAAYRSRRWDDAIQLFGRAIALAPDQALQRVSLAQAYDAWGKTDQACDVLRQAIEEIPDEYSLRVTLAHALGRDEKMNEANKILREALERWPDEPELYVTLGKSLRHTNQLQEAADAFNKAVELDPNSPDAQLNLGMCLYKLGEKEAGIAAAEKALAIRPDFLDALTSLGSIALETGDVEAADRYVGRLYSLGPDEPGARQMFAGLQLLKGSAADKAGKPDDAAKLYQAGLAIAPGFPPLLVESGRLAMRTGRVLEALQMFDQLVQGIPGEPGGYVLLGQALEKAGREAEAREVFERGLAVAENAGAQAVAAELRQALGR